MQRLTPSIALSALYYTFCDIVLLALIYYYRQQRRLHPDRFGASKIHLSADGERSPLLGGSDRSSYEDDEENPFGRRFRKFLYKHRYVIAFYILATTFIVTVGVASWISTGKHHTAPPQKEESWSTAGQIIGWTSAFLYLGSRIPQIFKNMQTKCQGLSLMMFALSVMGNVTYSGAILLPNTSPQHVWVNLSWLVGSMGTVRAVKERLRLNSKKNYRSPWTSSCWGNSYTTAKSGTKRSLSQVERAIYRASEVTLNGRPMQMATNCKIGEYTRYSTPLQC